MAFAEFWVCQRVASTGPSSHGRGGWLIGLEIRGFYRAWIAEIAHICGPGRVESAGRG